jgi:hypothetical protein
MDALPDVEQFLSANKIVCGGKTSVGQIKGLNMGCYHRRRLAFITSNASIVITANCA